MNLNIFRIISKIKILTSSKRMFHFFDEDDAVDSCNRSSTNRLVSARFKLRHYHLQIRCLKFQITVYTAATTTTDTDLP